MDRNQLVGVLLIFMLLIGYTYVNAPTEEQLAEQQRIQDSIAQAQLVLEEAPEDLEEIKKEITEVELSDSLQLLQLQSTLGSFAPSGSGTSENVVLENDKILINLNSLGGKITGVTLKDYDKVHSDSTGETRSKVRLLEDSKNKFDFLFPVSNVPNGIVKSSDLHFDVSQKGNSVSFKAKATNGGYFEQVYTLGEDYVLDYDIKFVNLDQILRPSENEIQLNWYNYLDRIENNKNFEKRYSTVYYKESEESNADYCSCASDDDADPESSLDWVSHVHQFFNSSLIAKETKFTSAQLSTQILDDSSDDMKLVKSQIKIPFNQSGSETFAMQWFLGPNEYGELKKLEQGLEQILPFGVSIVGTINRHIIRPFFNFLSQYIGSKGIVIIVLIFIIKMLLYPLMYKMLHSQAKMQALKPDIAKLTEKYKEDPQKKQMETMKIYREYGVSPFGGCMPMVLQMPIWYALFRFFPASITFRQESFLWANDLSSFDVFFKLPFELPMGMGAHISLFTLLWAATTLIYTYYNTKHMDMSANPAMKYVQYLMPVMFLGFFNSYASGLTCYMFFSNIFNILQTVITKKFVFNQDKIRAELEIEKSKPKKKSNFQARLEEAMKQQQMAQQKKKR